MSNIVKISKAKKKSKNRVEFLGLILVVLIICFLLLSPIFAIDVIEVRGNSNVLEKYIISESGLFYGQNIFNMNKFDAIEKINNIPQIAESSIKRELPDKLVINVVEKTPVAEVNFYGSKLLISSKGDVIKVITDNTETSLPKLKGITIKDVVSGKEVMCSEEETFQKYLQVLKILEKNDMVKNVDKLTCDNGILVHFDVGHIAYLGDVDNLEYKILWLNGIFEREENPSYIDLHNLEKVITKPVWGMFTEVTDEVANTEEQLRGEESEE